MELTSEEIERYARHLVLPEVGGTGQQKLKKARVLVIGAGGLGAPVLMYLAAAGVGTLGIVDDDTVSLSNLQRQIIHDTDQVGAKKVESARHAIGRVNPHVKVELHDTRLSGENARALVRGHDVVIDGSDNFATRYCVADACEAEGVALVTGAVGRFDGSVTTLLPFAERDGRKLPSYRDLFPAPPPEGTVPSCAEAGILGALTGVIGSIQAMEAIKLVTGTGDVLAGRLLLVDALSMRFETIEFG
ncbi:molybdopterin-synthase adenylyltransferase MoeB [Lutibaculum baratangense]|uniref:Molybdopterin-synthase adenylyltransferase n=1 Tax=Lutibaculum baratangense AMV1 TaxID=631454 RepID=V4R1J4_9HYPH|nr:molybdopterin-synthase adenylyltransferase MoeB [Lutibaculum baratangense]ESR25852.1 Molybdopterin biosynthesis protein MoeB [Lutibaculum baratangense AMV1]